MAICISIASGLKETQFKMIGSGAPADLDNPQYLEIQKVFRLTTCASVCSHLSCREFQYSETSHLCITRHTDAVSGGVINPGTGLFATYYKQGTDSMFNVKTLYAS